MYTLLITFIIIIILHRSSGGPQPPAPSPSPSAASQSDKDTQDPQVCKVEYITYYSNATYFLKSLRLRFF